MAQQRKVPLPIARYWVTAFGDKKPVLDAFFKNQSMLGFLKVLVTESIAATDDHPDGSFYVFVVKQADVVPWDGARFGFPTLAGADIKALSDTVDRPDLPQDGLDQLGDLLGSTGDGSGLLGGLQSGLKVAGYGLAAYVLFGLFSSKK